MAGFRSVVYALGGALLIVLSGCTAPTDPPGAASGMPSADSTPPARSTGPADSASGTVGPSTPASPGASWPRTPSADPTQPPAFDPDAALRDIEGLAGEIGPREATSRSFRAAAALVRERFEGLGFSVRSEEVEVPAGSSWGTPVRAGTSRNVVADPAGFDPAQPHVVVVAHLDTIAVAPGAEDNASGVSVLMELARLASQQPPALPVRFVAFGAEEPRGPGDALHHFGSQQHVGELSRAERRAIVAVVALDRVGVRASAVPVCSARAGGDDLRGEVRAAAREADVPTRSCSGNTTSDHWSYAKAGIPAVRIGSVPYAAYHSARDTPEVIDRRQVDRVGRLMWAWLQSVG